MFSRGTLIRLKRRDAGLTQRDVAVALDVTIGTVSGWELDKAMPRENVQLRLADMLGITLEELRSGGEGANADGNDSGDHPA